MTKNSKENKYDKSQVLPYDIMKFDKLDLITGDADDSSSAIAEANSATTRDKRDNESKLQRP